MIIEIDGEPINVDLKGPSAIALLQYDKHMQEGIKIKDDKGKERVIRIDKGIMRTSLKSLLLLFGLDMFTNTLNTLRRFVGIPERQLERHQDIINFIVYSFLEIVAHERDLIYVKVTTRIDENSNRTIESITTVEQKRNDTNTPRIAEETPNEDKGRDEILHSRQIGNGEDVRKKSTHRTRTFSA